MARLLLITCFLMLLAGCGGSSDVAQGDDAPGSRLAGPTLTEIKRRDGGTGPTTTTTVAPSTTTTAAAATTTTTVAPTTTTTFVPAEPIIADSGFSYLEDGDLSYAIILENPTETAALLSMWLDLNFIDDHGRIVQTNLEVIDFLLPEARTALGGWIIDPPDNIVDIEVDGDWNFVRVEDAEPGTWTVTDLAYEDGFFESITGFVSHTFGDDMDVIQMTAVFYDADGNITGGDWGFVDVPAGREVAFDISLFDPPLFDSFEVYVAP